MLELWEDVWIHELFLSYNIGEEKNSYYGSAERSTESKKNIGNAEIHLEKKEITYQLTSKHLTWKNW